MCHTLTLCSLATDLYIFYILFDFFYWGNLFDIMLIRRIIPVHPYVKTKTEVSPSSTPDTIYMYSGMIPNDCVWNICNILRQLYDY